MKKLSMVDKGFLLAENREMPMHVGGVDLSPVVALLIIWFLQRFLVQSLYDLARSV